MKVTNNDGLPEPVFLAIKRWLSRKRYLMPIDISVTELVDSPQVRRLKKKFDKEVEIEASAYLNAAFGSSVHCFIERNGSQYHHPGAGSVRGNELVRDLERFEQPMIYEFNERRIGGTPDYLNYDRGEIWDWKTASVWALLDGPKEEWQKQLQVYLYLAQRCIHGFKPGKRPINIYVWYKDWSRMKALAGNSYPQKDWDTFAIAPAHPDTVEKYIAERMELHFAKEVGSCTPEEKWERPKKFALMKKGRKSAVRLFDDAVVAMDMLANNPKYYMVERPGERVRCESYCPVRGFCEQKAREDAYERTSAD